MSKTLFIDLNTNQEVSKNILTINNYKQIHPHSEVTVLTYSENEKHFSIFNLINDIECIDREKIKKLKSSRLFSDAFAINEFLFSINKTSSTSWDDVILLSNNNITAFIASSINAQRVNGVTFNDYKYKNYSCEWAEFNNNITSTRKSVLFSNTEINNKILNTTNAIAKPTIKTNEKINAFSNSNFTKIKTKLGPDVSLIGVNICDAQLNESEFSEHLINTLFESSEYFPIVLYRNIEKEISFVKKLNARFNNSLISIKVEAIAMAPVLQNLDLVITNNQFTKSFTDITDTPSIFVAHDLSSANNYQHNEGNYIITRGTVNSVLAKDVLLLTNTILNPLKKDQISQLVNTVLRTEDVDNTTILSLVNWNDSTHCDFFFNTLFVLKKFKLNAQYVAFRDSIDAIPSEAKKSFILREKDTISNVVKYILSTIRVIKKGINTNNDADSLIRNLDALFSFDLNNSTLPMSLDLFQNRVENIFSEDKDENLSFIENHLYSLKDDIKLLAGLYNNVLESEITKQAKIVNKAAELSL
jgi:hypothetical protein